jgi:ABC-2 type transport system permease protein
VPAKRRVQIRDAWGSLPITRVLAVRDFKVRHKQAALGPLWLFIQPLGILAAFTVVFNGVAQVDTSGVPYPLFALVGITVWTYVSATLAFGVRTHITNREIIRYVDCPRIAFVTSTILSSLPNLAVPLVFTILGIFALGRELPVNSLLLPVAIAWLLLLLWGLVLGLSAANVRFRDVNALVPFFLQGGIFLTPIAYPLSDVPDKLDEILALNPFTGVIEFWRWCLLGAPLDERAVLIAAAGTVLTTVIGWRLFTRLEVRFADLI